ncbi:hypothetical protein D3C75_985390 [compost metagenome]
MQAGNGRITVNHHPGKNHRGPEHHVASQIDIFKAGQPSQQQVKRKPASNGDSYAAAIAFGEMYLADNIRQIHRTQAKHFRPNGLEDEQGRDDNPRPCPDNQKPQNAFQGTRNNIRQRFTL